MYLLIVDDDYQIRQGMCYGIEWKKIEIDRVDTCENGIEALKKCKEEMPDLIIADIQMPGMNGLEMLREIRALDQKTRVIFISAYSEFEYCRQALQMGANDYVLKPIRMKEFLDTIQKNVNAIQQDTLRNSRYEEAVQNELIREGYILESEAECDKLLNLLEKEHPFLLQPWLISVVCKPDHKSSRQDWRQFIKIIGEEKDKNFVILPLEQSMILLFEGCNSTLLTIYRQNEIAGKIRQWNCEYSGIVEGVSAGISQSHGRKELLEGYKQAKMALAYSFYQGESSVNIYPSALFENEISKEIEEYCDEEWKKMKQEDCLQMEYFFEKLLTLSAQKGITEKTFRRLLIKQYDRFSKEYGMNEEAGILQEELERCFYAKECVEKVISYLKKYFWHSDKKYSHMVELALKYMSAHFCEQINVEQVASFVGKSSNYFGSIFKKETGSSFTEYLTELRMERAKWLLLHTPFQVREISMKVGYGDYIYFSQVFRQYFGCSASELRNKEQGLDKSKGIKDE